MTSNMNAASPTTRWAPYAATASAVALTALLGAKPVDPRGEWYKTLDKPAWQPPAWVFGPVWGSLYASIAWAGGRALTKADEATRLRLAASLATNLALNAGWTWLFFRARSPRSAVVSTALLDASNAELIRRLARIDAVAATALVPYGGWCAFATVLNASIARRNPSAG
ncbi:tryptophan-rich sensory protein [Actinocrinis puniceicyclus]|uniref:Tryptophan-rich sensory protein n=1 Tax=Actinocrinis puniceicyclus TaxID=977794 RepID=A0A8J8B9R2_9ACTN|nr:TspO/MBR family protein [Actinocrinis puniceicyclus]MBS2962107.1 tryptophan-rich sensory protein [Actinocrinis puniceicyclus]